MEKLFILLMSLLLFRSVQSQEINNWVRIDCGSELSHADANGLVWQTDEGFIKTGENQWISPDSKTVLDQLRTLRVFRTQNKNCYSLPAPTIDRYFIRAMFHYGNYDRISNPPTFDLEFDGNKWATVETSMTETNFQEVMYTSKGYNVSVCLARTQDEQFPFISMLEIWAMPNDSYAIMSQDRAWTYTYRYNYGSSTNILGYPDDMLNRIWLPNTPAGLEAVEANFTSLDYTTVNEPPVKAITDAVQPNFSMEPIILPLTVDDINGFYHLALYFTEIVEDVNAIRKFYLNVNGAWEFTVAPQYKNCTGYSINNPSSYSLNIELVPTVDSTLPPIISALEVYTAIDSLVSTGTSQDDLDGLAVLIKSFEQLKGWSGEPCLPSDTIWQWLGCTGINPPRVTSINLTGYGLYGPIPDFSQMQALETINLANNSLNGLIPDFLGNLPNLKLLDLRENNFSGGIPRSITNNKKLTYYIDGMQNQQQGHEKNLALIVGLAVGIPIAILTAIAVIIMICIAKRKQTGSSEGQATQMEMGGVQSGNSQAQNQEENASMTISTVAQVKPPHTAEHMTPSSDGGSVVAASNGIAHSNQPSHANEQSAETASGEDISVSSNGGITRHPPGLQGIDDEELIDLLRQHGSSGVHARI